MSNGNTAKKIDKTARHDWERFDAMTDAQRQAAAAADPDARPLTAADFKRMKRTPRVRIVRRALGLTQQEFAVRFGIPLGTLRDWEQGAAEPDQAARTYLTVIANDPAAVVRALHRFGARSAGGQSGRTNRDRALDILKRAGVGRPPMKGDELPEPRRKRR